VSYSDKLKHDTTVDRVVFRRRHGPTQHAYNPAASSSLGSRHLSQPASSSPAASPQLNGDEDAILGDEDAIMLTTLDFNEVILD